MDTYIRFVYVFCPAVEKLTQLVTSYPLLRGVRASAQVQLLHRLRPGGLFLSAGGWTAVVPERESALMKTLTPPLHFSCKTTFSHQP